MKIKKRLTQQQEFEILKLVLDKFLWLGVAIMGFGIYKIFQSGAENLIQNILIMAGGAIVLLILMALLIREYEILQ